MASPQVATRRDDFQVWRVHEFYVMKPKIKYETTAMIIPATSVSSSTGRFIKRFRK
jgi:hypothetical protein